MQQALSSPAPTVPSVTGPPQYPSTSYVQIMIRGYSGNRKRKITPGHPWHLQSPPSSSPTPTPKKQSGNREKVKILDVILLDELDERCDLNSQRVQDINEVGLWFYDLLPGLSEMSVRKSLVTVFKTKLSLIKKKVEFFKCNRDSSWLEVEF